MARLTGTAALLGLLLATALFLALEELRWGALVLALSTGLTGAFALIEVWSVRAWALRPELEGYWQVSQGTAGGLPVHPTTGLYRSWVFHGRLAEEIGRADRYGHGLAVLLLEPADLLKEPTPETYAQAARALRGALRICDFAAQFDEARFVVLLPEADHAGAKTAGHRLLATLRSSSEPSTRWRGALVSYPEDGTHPNALLKRAVIALRRGRLESATSPPTTSRS